MQDHFSNYVQLYIAYDNARLTYPLDRHSRIHAYAYTYISIQVVTYACICMHINISFFSLSSKLIFSNAVRCVKSVQIHINLGV